MTRPTARTIRKVLIPLVAKIEPIDCGKIDAIEMKISNDMPLPIPRSVMSSAIHMIKPVPAVMVITISRMAYHASLVSNCAQAGSDELPNSAPLRATVMSVVDCRMPSAMVR